MNRRSFFATLAAAAAGFTILPPATTYERIWKPAPKQVWAPNPAWEKAEYEIVLLSMPPVYDQAIITGGISRSGGKRYRFEGGRFIEVPQIIT